MATKINLKVEKRNVLGRKVKNLRTQGILPVNLFGKGIKSQSLQVQTKSFADTYKKAGETNIVYLDLDGKKETPVLISNIQVHPVTGNSLHVDFYQVDLTKKVTVSVPVNLVGESLAVKEGGVLIQTLRELDVEALPTSIPESIDFDLSSLLKIGGSLKISDAKSIKDAEITNDKEAVIVQIQAQKEEEEPEAPVEEDVETEEGETKPEDGKEDVSEKTTKGEGKKEDKKEDSSKPAEDSKK